MTNLPGTLFLAPMAEVTTPALRRLVAEFSPGTVLFSEMLSAGAVAAGSPHNEPLLARREFDDPLIYQIAGSDPAVMADAARLLWGRGCAGVDINMGCPKHDIVKKGWGARLMTDPDRARAVVRACRKAVPGLLSVKIRAGWDSADPGALLAFAAMLRDEGADFITLHPRTAKMNFSRTADWSLVALAAARLGMPVVGNGDIAGPEDARDRMERAGCAGVMIGRAAARSPWIFRLAAALIAGREDRFDVSVCRVFLRAIDGVEEFLPANLHHSRCRRIAFYLSKNARFSHELFKSLSRCEDMESMRGTVRAYFERNPQEDLISCSTGKGGMETVKGV